MKTPLPKRPPAYRVANAIYNEIGINTRIINDSFKSSFKNPTKMAIDKKMDVRAIWFRFRSNFQGYGYVGKHLVVVYTMNDHVPFDALYDLILHYQTSIRFLNLGNLNKIDTQAQNYFLFHLLIWADHLHAYATVNIIPRRLLLRHWYENRELPVTFTLLNTKEGMMEKIKEHNKRIIEMVMAEIKMALDLTVISNNQSVLVRLISVYLIC